MPLDEISFARKDDSSSSRRSPTKVRVDGVVVDFEGISHPRRSAPSSRPQESPKPKVPDRQRKSGEEPSSLQPILCSVK